MTIHEIKDREGNIVKKIDSETPEGQEFEKTLKHAKKLESFIAGKKETATSIPNPFSWLFFKPNNKAEKK